MRPSLRLSVTPLLVAALPLHAQRVAKDASPAAAARATTYHVSHRVQLGGAGGWDYLAFDTTAHRVFVTRGTHVMVIDARADTLLGDVADTPGVHGVALAPDLGKGWASDGRDSSITVFDHATLAPTKRVHEPGANPDAITYDPATRRVFAFNGRSGDAVVIDATTDSVIGTIALGGKPESVVRELSPDAYRVVQTVRTMPGARTMTLDPVSHRLYTVSAEFEPSTGQGRPPMKPGTFTLLVLEP